MFSTDTPARIIFLPSIILAVLALVLLVAASDSAPVAKTTNEPAVNPYTQVLPSAKPASHNEEEPRRSLQAGRNAATR
jgi:hypothetical protein